jgi:hypothetical protein
MDGFGWQRRMNKLWQQTVEKTRVEHMFRQSALLLFINSALLLHAGSAVADGTACEKVDSDYFSVDGMLDDWRRIKKSWKGKDPRDAAYRLGCAYDAKRLYLVMDVRDQRLLRYKSGAQDEVRIKLGGPERALSISLLPGTRGFDTKVRLGKKKAPKWLEVVDSLQPSGFSVEASVPLRRIPGYGPSAPGVQAKIEFVDVDKGRSVANRIRYQGLLYVGSGKAIYKAFLRAAKLSSSDIRLDKMVNVDTARGAERVLHGKAVIGVLSDSFSFMGLPVQSAADVLKVRVIDFAGNGRSFVLAHYRQHGNGGSREIVAVYKVAGDGTFPVLTSFEVAKSVGTKRIENKWGLVKKGSRRKLARGEKKRGFDILVEALPAVGWDEDSFEEAPARDVNPILLPWMDETAVVYHFDGTVVSRSTAR